MFDTDSEHAGFCLLFNQLAKLRRFYVKELNQSSIFTQQLSDKEFICVSAG